MAAFRTCEQPTLSSQEMSIHVTNNNNTNVDKNDSQGPGEDEFDYSQKAQWLRAAMLGANDGLVSVASLMMGVGAVKDGIKAMLLAGFAGIVAGTCSMAIGEIVSVYTQRDIEPAQLKRERMRGSNGDYEENSEREKLPSPFQAAIASALDFSIGAVVLLLAAVFIKQHKVRLAVAAIAASLALAVFGVAGDVLGRTPVVRSSFRVLIGGWMAMGITFGLIKLVGTTAL